MAAKLERTNTPGIFKRGNRYAVIYRMRVAVSARSPLGPTTPRGGCALDARPLSTKAPISRKRESGSRTMQPHG
jgi:hypothetical protein